MVSSLTNPPTLVKPFANEGDKNTIPTGATGTQAASLEEGFPQLTSTPISDGGIPPQREDFNGLGFLTTSQYFYLQNGGRFTFNDAVSTAINGYPEGAVLQYTDPGTGQSYEVTSLIPNNTYNFVTHPEYIDDIKWRKSFSEDLSNYVTLNTAQTISGAKSFTSGINVNALNSYSAIGTGTKGTTPSTTLESRFRYYDKNGSSSNSNCLGGMRVLYYNDGKIATQLQAYKPQASSTTNETIQIIYPASGDPYTYAPTPSTSDDSNKIATTAHVKDVLSSSGNGLAEYSFGRRSYLKFSNGLIIQWGTTTSAEQNVSITLPTPFSNTNYSVTITSIGTGGVYQRLISSSTNKTTTTFATTTTGGANNYNFCWQAMGY